MHTFGSCDVSLRHSIFMHTRVHAHTDWPIPHILLHNHCNMCSLACGHTPYPYTNVWSEGFVVVLHVKECLQTCCFVVFIVVPYHTHIQSFSFITCPISQLCAQLCPYYNVLPVACFNENYNVYNIFDMTLHAWLISKPDMSAKFHSLVLFSL